MCAYWRTNQLARCRTFRCEVDNEARNMLTERLAKVTFDVVNPKPGHVTEIRLGDKVVHRVEHVPGEMSQRVGLDIAEVPVPDRGMGFVIMDDPQDGRSLSPELVEKLHGFAKKINRSGVYHGTVRAAIDDAVRASARAVDKAFISGDGLQNTPKGLFNVVISGSAGGPVICRYTRPYRIIDGDELQDMLKAESAESGGCPVPPDLVEATHYILEKAKRYGSYPVPPGKARASLEDDVNAAVAHLTDAERASRFQELRAAGMNVDKAAAIMADRKRADDEVEAALTYHVLRIGYGCR